MEVTALLTRKFSSIPRGWREKLLNLGEMNRSTHKVTHIVGSVKAHICSLVYRMAKGSLMAVHCTWTPKALRFLGLHGIESLVRCVEKRSDGIGVLRITGNSYAH